MSKTKGNIKVPKEYKTIEQIVNDICVEKIKEADKLYARHPDYESIYKDDNMRELLYKEISAFRYSPWMSQSSSSSSSKLPIPSSCADVNLTESTYSFLVKSKENRDKFIVMLAENNWDKGNSKSIQELSKNLSLEEMMNIITTLIDRWFAETSFAKKTPKISQLMENKQTSISNSIPQIIRQVDPKTKNIYELYNSFFDQLIKNEDNLPPLDTFFSYLASLPDVTIFTILSEKNLL